MCNLGWFVILLFQGHAPASHEILSFLIVFTFTFALVLSFADACSAVSRHVSIHSAPRTIKLKLPILTHCRQVHRCWFRVLSCQLNLFDLFHRVVSSSCACSFSFLLTFDDNSDFDQNRKVSVWLLAAKK